MNLKELLDYSSGNTIGNRLTSISSVNNGNKLGRPFSDLYNNYSVLNKKLIPANSNYEIDVSSDIFKLFDYETAMKVFNLSGKYYKIGKPLDKEVDPETGKQVKVVHNFMTGEGYEDGYWDNIIRNNYSNILPSKTGEIYRIIVDQKDIGYTIKGKLSGCRGSAIVNMDTGGGEESDFIEGTIVGTLIGFGVGGLFGSIIGASAGFLDGIISGFGDVPGPGFSCASLVSFMGVQYYIKPYYIDGELLADYTIYFEEDPDNNYNPFVITHELNMGLMMFGRPPIDNLSKIKKIKNKSGTLKLLDISDPKKLLNKFDRYELSLGRYIQEAGGSSMGGLIDSSVTYAEGSAIDLKIGMYKYSDLVIISIYLVPRFVSMFRPFMPGYKSMAYTLVDKHSIINSVGDSYTRSELDNLLNDCGVTAGCSSYWVSDPLDSTDNPHLTENHFRGYYESLPDPNDVSPMILIGDVVAIGNENNNIPWRYTGSSWVELDEGETPLIVESELNTNN